MEFDPAEMARRGKLGGLTTHSRVDSRKHTEPARAAFRDRFLREVDPNNELPIEERERRAQIARRLYFTRLGQKSAAARSARKRQQATGAVNSRDLTAA